MALTLLTAGDRANLRHLAGADVDEMVFIEDVEAELVPALARVEETDRVLRAARSIEQAPNVPEHVRAAIVTVLTARPPLHTAQAVARRVGIRPNRLSEAFHRFHADTGWSLPDLMRVVILRQVAVLLRTGSTVKAACRELQLGEGAVRRAAARYCGGSPKALSKDLDELEGWIDRFVASVIRAASVTAGSQSVIA